MIESLPNLAELLGYSSDRGFIRAEEFSYQPNHRHALRMAAQEMGISSAYGLWMGPQGSLRGPEHERFMPLVYLAVAKDADHAQRIHRSVWSQGLVPYLLVLSDRQAWLCKGFSYSSSDWTQHASELTVDDIAALASGSPERSALQPILARTLRSSVAWRDEARVGDEFIDERLLRSLADLSVVFSEKTFGAASLAPEATNALVARLLYFYFLVDRHFITTERLSAWGLAAIPLHDDGQWSLEAAKTLFARLDEVFNGSIFPMPSLYADAYTADHINTLRRVLRHGARPERDGSLQLSFLDYDFASIRTETLSAIYEMFLRNEVADAGSRFGAFYTPPFLADYLLDRLEDERPLTQGVRVLDPAAGSGVFLVGAYRRIVESCLRPGETHLHLAKLHELMTTTIFGVELNPTACHVAAFSLYLTMLDYVSAGDAADYTKWPTSIGQPRLFPSMLKPEHGRTSNIIPADFFSPEVDGVRCDVVVGNPPWVQLPKLKSEHADAYYAKIANTTDAVGDKQAAELFTWKAYNEHLEEAGTLSLLLPQKSLVNSFSEGFAAALRRKTSLLGIADLAHLRYKLFRRNGSTPSSGSSNARGARQSTAAVILSKRSPTAGALFWSFKPLLSTQPSGKRDRMWVLVHDWTQVSWHNQTDLGTRDWRRIFTCSPIDRRLLGYIDRQIESGRLSRLSDLDSSLGLQFKIEVDQKINREFVLSMDRNSPNYWLRHLGSEKDLLGEKSRIVPLPQEQIERAIPSARPFVQGNVVLMPRTCEKAIFVKDPVAPSFMIVACFSAFGGRALPAARKKFLRALAAYMSTRTFRYLCFVNGRRMTIDRASIELSAVTELPWPFGGLNDPALGKFLDAGPAERERMVSSALGIPSPYQATVREFNEFREKFRDGGTPPDALRQVTEHEMDDYLRMLLREIDGRKCRHAGSIKVVSDELAAVVIRYVPHDQANGQGSTDEALAKAVKRYKRDGASTLAQSRYIWHSPELMISVLLKPRSKLYWTLDRAYSDADLAKATAMAGLSGRVAA